MHPFDLLSEAGLDQYSYKNANIIVMKTVKIQVNTRLPVNQRQVHKRRHTPVAPAAAPPPHGQIHRNAISAATLTSTDDLGIRT